MKAEVLCSRLNILDYAEVLKPRETTLLTFIGVMAAVIAGGKEAGELGRIILVVGLGSAGVNGLTNYLDREVDARMARTRHRALPSRRIHPPEKVLPLMVGLVALALVLAWGLHPLAFFAGLLGTGTALVGRKSGVTHLLGGISGAAPVLVGWLAVNSQLSPGLLVLCLLVLAWVPLHVGSLMLVHREDYLGAGIKIFPLTWEERDTHRLLLALALLVVILSGALYFVGPFSQAYLVIATLLGLALVWAAVQGHRSGAWSLYKLSAYPYLGFLFLALAADAWF